MVTDGSRCFLPAEERQLVASILQAFAEDFVTLLNGPCPSPRDIPIPKIVDLTDGRVVYDERQRVKRSDWTYAD